MAETQEADYWTINSQALRGDNALFYLTAPLSSFTAWGVVQTDASAEAGEQYGWPGHYMSKIGEIRLISPPISRKEAMQRFSAWGYLKTPIRSVVVPQSISTSLRGLLQEERNDRQSLPDIDEMMMSGLENTVKLREHLVRERDRSFVLAKKQQVLKNTGKLECEICMFDFNKAYGKIGEGFCEVHHKMPLSKLQVTIETKSEDLAILCSNCHRMIHRHFQYLL